jgi:shikimate dehydrogenase
MRTFGLIGKPLLHSKSQEFFTNKFLEEKIADAEYRLFSLDSIEEVKRLFKHPTLLGFNVTIPYKSEIIPFLDELDVVAKDIGAVNCVVKQKKKWVGYNTDVIGFENTMQMIEVQKFKSLINSYALVLGSGGAAKAVCYVLKQRNIPFQIVSRKKTEKTITYNDLTELIINHSPLIINTTPLGMFPQTDEKPPIPYPALNSEHILIDLIYNPEETLFLKEGKKRGATVINGLAMFETQAEATYMKFKNNSLFYVYLRSKLKYYESSYFSRWVGNKNERNNSNDSKTNGRNR